MGKKQHQKDKLYLTCTEWSTFYGGKKKETKDQAEFRRLPFYCCSISFQPFENPVCTKEGIIFDLVNVVPFIKKHGINPVTGEKMSGKDVIKLKFYKNSDGKYHCPVTFKVFNDNTHFVAIRPTGNVFAYEAVERLNIKPQHYKDLLNDEPFVRKDIVTLQDPANLDKFNFATFYHIKNNIRLVDDEEERAKSDPKYRLRTMNRETSDILAELDREYKAPEKESGTKATADKINAAHYSTGAVSASFTSTAMVRTTEHENAIIDEDLLIYERVKKKCYVRLVTNLGPLNLELHSDMVPRTCDNFIKLCQKGYYNYLKFHRSIRNFMIQGGDPDGTGSGGESAFGTPFRDEFRPNLTHTGRGMLSMANSGPHTNKSQFFITYRSCRHLDNKHTVFGKVVGGLETIDAMEKVKCDKHDHPDTEIIIESAVVFVNPYEDAIEQLASERQAALDKQAADEVARKKSMVRVKSDDAPKVFRSGVGKYIKPDTIVPSGKHKLDTNDEVPVKKKVKTGGHLMNFSSW